jgi:hypothetical protein
MDAVPRHLAPRLPFRHRHLNNSERLESADHVISFPQLSHSTLRRIKPTSFMNWMASAISVKRDVRNIRLGAPSKQSNRRWYENRGALCISRKRRSYWWTTATICSTTIVDTNRTNCTQEQHRQSARTVHVQRTTTGTTENTQSAQYSGSAVNWGCRVEVEVSRRTMGVSYSDPWFFSYSDPWFHR